METGLHHIYSTTDKNYKQICRLQMHTIKSPKKKTGKKKTKSKSRKKNHETKVIVHPNLNLLRFVCFNYFSSFCFFFPSHDMNLLPKSKSST